MGGEGGKHRVPALPVGGAQAGDLRLEMALLAETQRDPLAERRGVEVGDLLELREAGDQSGVARRVADADAGDDRLAEGAGIDGPGIASQGSDRRERLALVAQIMIS